MRKLGRPAKERVALLRNQVSDLLWFGKLETTLEKAKEVRPIAEKMITLAMNTVNDTVVVTKEKVNEKGEKVQEQVTIDGPKKLAARRKMMSYLRDLQEVKAKDESKSEFKKRKGNIQHPLIEKLYAEYAVKYNEKKEKGSNGGYTRIMRLGVRRGDAAEMAIIELI